MSLGLRRNPTVLLTGGTGFVGGAIRGAADEVGVPLRLLVRDGRRFEPSRDVVVGDLSDAASVDAALRGIDTVIHAASYVGHDPDLQRRVNVAGTEILVDRARRHGVRALLYVSTFGVYGGRLAPGAPESEARPSPRSALSASRFEAEQLVLAAGGAVIRPALVYGEGDRWVLGPLVKLIRHLGAWIEGGGQRVSAIDRETLGRLIVGLIGPAAAGGVFHAAMPSPVTVAELAGALMDTVGIERPTSSISRSEASERLGAIGVEASVIEMVTRDNWLDAHKIWAATGLPEPVANVRLTQAAVRHYAGVLGK